MATGGMLRGAHRRACPEGSENGWRRDDVYNNQATGPRLLPRSPPDSIAAKSDRVEHASVIRVGRGSYESATCPMGLQPKFNVSSRSACVRL